MKIPYLLALVTGAIVGIEGTAIDVRGTQVQYVLGKHENGDIERDAGRPNKQSALKNAPHIFNALHSALRQWGSSLHHNGMSFFPASIPAKTLLYHGTQSNTPPNRTEWLAFEIEHAEMFARPRFQRNGTRPGGPPGGRPPGGGKPGEGRPPGPPPMDEQRADEEEQHGYLHTYITTRRLTNILYIDGLSAGKTLMGTLDTQDYILRSSSNSEPPPGSRPNSDYARAVDLCALSAEWGLEVDGFIRMEAGFELIMCDFGAGALDVVSINQRPASKGQQENYEVQHFEYMRGVAARYGGIGGGRVQVAHDMMVSAYFLDVDLGIESSKNHLPRLENVDKKVLGSIKDDVRDMLLSHQASLEAVTGNYQGSGADWQGVVDMITLRYSPRLQYLLAPATTTPSILAELDVLLNVFVNYSAPISTRIPEAVTRCGAHYLAPITLSTPTDHLIHAAVSEVTGRICSVLFNLWETVKEKEKEAITEVGKRATGELALQKAREDLQELVQWLNWSSWLDCGKCEWDEVCYVAAWPFGSVEDHERPRCLNSTMMVNRRGYWDWQ